jgi:predicted RNA-binding Zn ribbon-like protein
LIPHNLDLVIDYVNTLDVEEGKEALRTPQDLAAWLSQRGLLATGASLERDDFGAALELREALRALMLANNGGPEDAGAWSTLERAACRGGLGVHFSDRGEVCVRPADAGVAGALARLLVPIPAALADHSWQRAKACRCDDCLWAFYDRSRNRSAAWCEMAVCGNRTKVRAYRERASREAS